MQCTAGTGPTRALRSGSGKRTRKPPQPPGAKGGWKTRHKSAGKLTRRDTLPALPTAEHPPWSHQPGKLESYE
ncbi:hypothetical protein PspLS_04856 [Pyricularia sp. CBS 133598]|nr:hypothetical protein PspLS_04856 [Pyricularia sp. CBS 133598]